MSRILCLWVILGTAFVSYSLANDFGSAVVGQVLAIQDDGGIVCDLENMPDIIGKGIVVYLAEVEFSADQPIKPQVKQFLHDTLIKPTEKPRTIQLEHLQRGKTFSLIACMVVDGRDLAQMLVEKGFAQRTIRLERQTPPLEGHQLEPPTKEQSAKSPTEPSRQQQAIYVCSKSSKVYHRPDCSHARRLSPGKTLTFTSRQQAEQSGRRPCKTCNP